LGERLAIDRLIIRGAVLPTPREDAEPCDCESPYGRLMRFALSAVRLVVELGPEGLPDRCCCPLHTRVAEELGTLEAPVAPGLLPTACGARGNPRLFLQCGSARRACALFAHGPEKAGGEDRPRAGEGLAEGEVGRTLGTRRDGGVAVGNGLHGDAARGHQGLDPQGMGGEDALSRGQRCGSLDGMAALCDHVVCTDMVVAQEGLTRGAARELGRVAGGPAAQKITEKGRSFLLTPLQHLRDIVFPRTGEAVGHPHFSPDHATTMGDALCEGAHGGAWRLEWRQLLPMRAPHCALQGGVAGIIFGPARGEGFTLPRQCQRSDRAEDQKVILAQGKDPRPFVKCEAERHGWAVQPRTPCGAPRIDRLGRVLQLEARSFCRASRLEASSLLGIRPGDPTKGRTGGV
jgi:hypothetical protein